MANKTPEAMAVSIASIQGASALYTDMCVLDNPYPIRTPMYDAWEKGWINAYQMAVKQFAFFREVTLH